MYNLLNDTIVYNYKLVCGNAGYFRASQEQLMLELSKIESENINFTLYPNPGKSKITIITKGFDKDAVIIVYNYMGQLIKSYKITKGSTSSEIDISTWSEGYYSIHCTSGNFSAVKPLIKIK